MICVAAVAAITLLVYIFNLIVYKPPTKEDPIVCNVDVEPKPAVEELAKQETESICAEACAQKDRIETEASLVTAEATTSQMVSKNTVDSPVSEITRL